MTTTAAKVRVLIVDDRPLVLAGIHEMLSEDSSIEVIGAATDAVQALQMTAAESPDVVFLDVRLPHRTGFDLISGGRKVSPLSEFLALAVSDDPESFRDALSRGAHGYLLDGASRDDICAAVQRVASGKSHIDPAVSGHLVQPTRARSKSDTPTLTARELDVLRLAAQGLTNGAIAQRLGVKSETVKTHLSRAFERLGARDRANAVAICMRRGLL
ncbi:MAG: DNA-binding response regulator [Actinobacteria bacterium HGW-Actinobacteria-7]|jgi:DNA-binding NarL/FixJ family response regulator|nr:MAG: DNA-binding response regulator [Actinobacteria bacterium HGW-Actinobacteria-7]